MNKNVFTKIISAFLSANNDSSMPKSAQHDEPVETYPTLKRHEQYQGRFNEKPQTTTETPSSFRKQGLM
jgi:hypothetical protein